jgi:hypothetical protein
MTFLICSAYAQLSSGGVCEAGSFGAGVDTTEPFQGILRVKSNNQVCLSQTDESGRAFCTAIIAPPATTTNFDDLAFKAAAYFSLFHDRTPIRIMGYSTSCGTASLRVPAIVNTSIGD